MMLLERSMRIKEKRCVWNIQEVDVDTKYESLNIWVRKGKSARVIRFGNRIEHSVNSVGKIKMASS